MAIKKHMLLATLFASLTWAFPKPPLGTAVNTTTCNGQTFVYEALAGYGFVPSNSRDKFGDTAGGFGSSAAIDQTSWKVDKSGVYSGILWALPDRGWNTEGTLNFQPRIHKFAITFRPDYTSTANDPSAPNLHLELLDTIRFTDPFGAPLTGLDADAHGPYLTFPGFPPLPSATYTGDGFGGNGVGGRRVSLDSEGLVLSPDGSFWVSDEYGPFIYHFAPSGRMLSAIQPPPALIPERNGTESFSAASPPRYDPDLETLPKNNPTGRDNNQGFEGLTVSHDNRNLYALMQSALNQEGGLNSTTRVYTRLLHYDISNPFRPEYKAEYVLPLPKDPAGRVAAQSEIHFVSPTQFLVLARDSNRGHGQKNSDSRYRHVDVYDISKATDIRGPAYDCPSCAVASVDGVLDSDIVPATYCSWLDYNVNSQLNRFGLHNGGDQDAQLLNEKWESIALAAVQPPEKGCIDGHPATNGEYFLFSLSDNDFITQNGFMNGGELPYADASGYNLDNQVLVFKVKLPIP
ncbi:hypothetical protein A1O1_05868 [Capronia coronata CBS 617.96]|uniref:Phytase-like domain-containing protein n=1 Tax=Capronia coronata CBS 617.96 TaxID=1182541 RepID=W9YT95_9EURO|nr:uncharacterized protein A1O1_05868 [Capronia coronata CBS 617.96]EXJ85504.1 hypothetical protein A1O1_05868 [Capronia coronata CBS 617.96]